MSQFTVPDDPTPPGAPRPRGGATTTPTAPSPSPSPSSGQSGESGVGAALHQAPDELARTKDEAVDRARDLVGETRTQLRGQVDEQTTKVVQGIRRASSELDRMASSSSEPDGPLAEAMRQLGQVGERAGSKLESGGVEGLASDVAHFARRRPGVFLGIAFGAGLLAGRVLRSDVEHRRDDHDQSLDRDADIDLRDDLSRPATTAPSAGLPSRGDAIGAVPGAGAV